MVEHDAGVRSYVDGLPADQRNIIDFIRSLLEQVEIPVSEVVSGDRLEFRRLGEMILFIEPVQDGGAVLGLRNASYADLLPSEPEGEEAIGEIRIGSADDEICLELMLKLKVWVETIIREMDLLGDE